MDNESCYEAKLPEIQAIKSENIISNINIPVDIYLQEAENLYKWTQTDKNDLISAGLKWKIVEDIPIRAGALREAESRWITQRFTKQETGKKWKEGAKEVFELRNLLLHEFRYAYRNDEYLLSRINAIAGSQSYAALLQDLNDLSVLGKQNQKQLKAINFDLSRLDATAELAKNMAAILADANADSEYSAAKILRDKALTFLKIIVDEVCACGQYVFWKNPERKKGYSSRYLRRLRKYKGKPDNNNEDSTGNSEEKT